MLLKRASWAGVALLIVGTYAFAVSSTATADPNGSITYTAKVWLPGLKVVVPNAGWKIYEDQPGEFSLTAPASLGEGGVHFWLDPHASGPLGAPLPRPVAGTPSALSKWLRGNPNLTVSAPTSRRAAGITMKSVKLDLSRRAPKEDPTCTTPCLTYFVFSGPGYNFPFGTARGEVVRLYLRTVQRSGHPHTLAILVSAPARTFASADRIANGILAKTQLPPDLKTG